MFACSAMKCLKCNDNLLHLVPAALPARLHFRCSFFHSSIPGMTHVYFYISVCGHCLIDPSRYSLAASGKLCFIDVRSLGPFHSNSDRRALRDDVYMLTVIYRAHQMSCIPFSRLSLAAIQFAI